MKKMSRKLFSLGLGSVLVLGMVGCGSATTSKEVNKVTPEQNVASTENKEETKETETSAYDQIEKPEKITMMVNGNFVSVANGQEEIVKKYKELTGIDLEITTIDHNSYNNQLALAFASGDVPDVVILATDFYAAYAAQGALADVTEYWEQSDAKTSGRFKEQYIDSLYVDDKLYGFAAARGNGCLTYLRQDWLDNLGLNVPTNYDEYIDVLRAFTFDDPDGNGINDTYGVTAPGLVSTTYLPELWQKGDPVLHKDAEGKWVDGMVQPETAEALQRLKDAYKEGLIDVEVATNKTSACRDKFYASNVGAFTYWAGKWNRTLEENLQAVNPEGKLVAISPIKELGQYVERATPAIAITAQCENPGGVFKYLFDFMVDGGEGQMLFTYGVEGVHYEEKDGVYTQLPSLENPSTTFTCTYIDPLLSLADWKEENPFSESVVESVTTSNDIFMANSRIADMQVSNDIVANYASAVNDIRETVIADIVTTDLSVEDGIKRYKAEVGTMAQEMVDSLN